MKDTKNISKVRNFLWTIMFLIQIGCSKETYLKSNFPKLNFNPILKNQIIAIDKAFLEKNISGIKMRFEGDLKDHQLTAEVMMDIGPEKAAILMNNKIMLIKGFYGENTQIDLTSMDNKIQTSQQFNLKATARLVLGVSDEDQNVFRAQTLLLYCKNDKMFYDLRYYYPKNNKLLTTPIASCAN